MKWNKLGHVFVSDNNNYWMISHASNTVAKFLYDDVFRIYFSSRDIHKRSHITYIDVDINKPFKILAIAPKPVVVPGELGTFDDSGTSLSCIINIKNDRPIYYYASQLAN